VSLVVTPLKIQARTLGYLCATPTAENKPSSEGPAQDARHRGRTVRRRPSRTRAFTRTCKATFHQTIQGLANAIDKMDRYTAGHSERVAAYAQILAIKLGLPPEMVEIVRSRRSCTTWARSAA
jgi:HD-GYP domain-containing protein (c-di-GMP phosphodiesterase class II)